jgi:hypothetical protein
MTSSSDEIARYAAQSLGQELDSALPGAVDAQLLAGGRPPGRFEPVTLTIALAGLLIRAAQLGWNIYRDLKKDATVNPAPDVIGRRIRIELAIDEKIPVEQRDRIIAAVADALAKHRPEA